MTTPELCEFIISVDEWIGRSCIASGWHRGMRYDREKRRLYCDGEHADPPCNARECWCRGFVVDTTMAEAEREVEGILRSDSRISQPMRGNGLVAREVDGTPSHVIRMGIDDVLRIAPESVVKDQDKRARCPGFGEHSEACETQCEARGDCRY